jgi:uncharacterized protein YbbC (DUF1343 family)
MASVDPKGNLANLRRIQKAMERTAFLRQSFRHMYLRMGLFLAFVLACAPVLRADPAVKLGIDVLEEKNFAGLVGKRIGLITNATGIDSHGVSTIDVLRRAPGVRLVALFGPEHGVYGADWAGAYVPSSIDAHTGLPVYSLYGPTRKPTPEMLKGIDILMYDIQDIGCRSYTFISTLGLAMEAAGQAGIPFYVLDRPNPLNGNRVEGMLPDPDFRNFECQWNIPYVYGLTPGELAYMIRDSPGWIKAKPALTIVPMVGWYRSMYWDQTGLIWIPTSPHIPTADTALDYVATGFLGEAGGINHGIGYTLPFKLVGHPSFDSFALADEFNGMGLSGTLFRPATWEPFYGVFKNQIINGVQIYYTDRDQVDLCGLAAHILYTVYHKPGVKMFRTDASGDSGPDAFDKIAGGPTLRLALQQGQTPEEIIGSWQPGLTAFREERRRFLIYGERPATAPQASSPAPATPPSHAASPD